MTSLEYSTTATYLREMRQEIAADSPLLAERLRDGDVDRGPGYADLFVISAGNKPGDAAHYCFSLEYIFEGYLLHYGSSRLLASGSDNFDLLAGDYMYARGLNRLAALDEPLYIRLMSELISLCSYIHGEGLAPQLALDAWAVTALCLAGLSTGVDGITGAWRLGDYAEGIWRNGNGGGLSEARELLLVGFDGRRQQIEGCLAAIDGKFTS